MTRAHAFGRLTNPPDPAASVHRPQGAQECAMRDVWTTKNRYMITWLRAANQMTYAALANAEAESQQRLALVPAEKTAQVIDFWSGRHLTLPEGKRPLR